MKPIPTYCKCILPGPSGPSLASKLSTKWGIPYVAFIKGYTFSLLLFFFEEKTGTTGTNNENKGLRLGPRLGPTGTRLGPNWDQKCKCTYTFSLESI